MPLSDARLEEIRRAVDTGGGEWKAAIRDLLREVARLRALPPATEAGRLWALLEGAKMALGTGDCKVNTCEGCKVDDEMALGQVTEALALLGTDAATQPEVG